MTLFLWASLLCIAAVFWFGGWVAGICAIFAVMFALAHGSAVLA